MFPKAHPDPHPDLKNPPHVVMRMCDSFRLDDAMRDASYNAARLELEYRKAFRAHQEACGTPQADKLYKEKMKALKPYIEAVAERSRAEKEFLDEIHRYAILKVMKEKP